MDLTPYKNCLAHTQSLFIDTAGNTKPCCYFNINLPSELNFQKHQNLLKNADIKVGCDHCIKIEQSGTQWSHRQKFSNNSNYIISVFFDSLCNQSCVTCFAKHSSSVALEWQKSSLISDDEFQRIRRIEQYSDKKLELIKEIVSNKSDQNITIEVYGGEPTSSPHLLPMIEWLVENNYSKNITLSLISNGSRILKNLETHLNNFKYISICFSIDGVDEHFTYLRWPTSFKLLQDNIDYHYDLSLKYDNLMLGYNYTLSWMNSLVFFNFLNWIESRYPNLEAYMTKLVERKYFSIDVLSDSTREHLLQLAKTYKNSNNEKIINLYIDYLSGRIAESDSEKIYQAIRHMKKLDQVRNTNCVELFADILKLENIDVE